MGQDEPMRVKLAWAGLASSRAFNGASKAHSPINSTTVAICISLAALIVSIILPLLLDRRQAPRLTVRIGRIVFLDLDGSTVECYAITAINHGRSRVTINQVSFSYIHKGRGGLEIFLMSTPLVRSPSVPHVVEPYANTAFHIEQDSIRDQLEDTKNDRIYGSLNLSNGYRVVSRKGLAPETRRSIPRRHTRMRRLKLIIFGKERSGWY
jgi:hypothetical protein